MSQTFLRVEFREKDEVKRLGAYWNADQRQWYVPAGRDLTPFARWLPVQEGSAAYSHDEAPVMSAPGLSLREVIQRVRGCLRRGLPDALWIRAELTQVDPKPSGVFLDVVERDETREVASIKAVIWNHAEPLLAQFRQHTGQDLAAGMQVLVKARVEVQDRYGLRLIIETLDPAYTVGVMANQLKAIRQTLHREGIMDRNRQRAWPEDFFNVAVISPEGAAGLGDFQAGATPLERYGICQFHYLTAVFQGPKTQESLLRAMQTAWALPDVQALAILRGGGAVADLHWLNELELARAVCLSPVPVITGIGHERDQTILDEVACRVEGTPSKVIKRISETIQQRAARTQTDVHTIQTALDRRLSHAERTVEAHLHIVRLAARSHLQQAQLPLDAIRQAVIAQSAHRLEVADTHLMAHHATVIRETQRALTSTGLDRARATVLNQAARLLRQAGDDAQRLVREILGQGPERTLRRGFALVRNEAGQPVTSRATASQQTRLSLEFHDGVILVQRGTDDDPIRLPR